MSKILTDLLATDAVARQFGVALKPDLRAAFEADLRFHSRAASPALKAPVADEDLPANTVRLSVGTPEQRKRKA